MSDIAYMDFELYKKCINDMTKFPEKIRGLRFIGYGEPLRHKYIDQMVDYAVKKEVANVVDLLTNGVLLTPDLSKRLINAGLSSLRISVQGISVEKYKQISGIDINFD